MKKEDFVKYIETLKKINSKHDKLRGAGICLIDYDEDFYIAINLLLKTIFTEQGVDLINDYIYNNQDITIYKVKTKKVICVINSPETLWSYLNKNGLTIFKNK